MAIEIVSFPITNGDLPEGNSYKSKIFSVAGSFRHIFRPIWSGEAGWRENLQKSLLDRAWVRNEVAMKLPHWFVNQDKTIHSFAQDFNGDSTGTPGTVSCSEYLRHSAKVLKRNANCRDDTSLTREEIHQRGTHIVHHVWLLWGNSLMFFQQVTIQTTTQCWRGTSCHCSCRSTGPATGMVSPLRKTILSTLNWW